MPGAVQLLLLSQVIFSFQKSAFKVAWLLWPPADKCYVQEQWFPLQTNNLQCTAHQRMFVDYLEELKIPLKERIFSFCYATDTPSLSNGYLIITIILRAAKFFCFALTLSPCLVTSKAPHYFKS